MVQLLRRIERRSCRWHLVVVRGGARDGLPALQLDELRLGQLREPLQLGNLRLQIVNCAAIARTVPFRFDCRRTKRLHPIYFALVPLRLLHPDVRFAGPPILVRRRAHVRRTGAPVRRPHLLGLHSAWRQPVGKFGEACADNSQSFRR
eukprot:scaffold33549_cov72-Phaeocystis_antarctica.AAC.1